MKQASYYTKLDNNKAKCSLCPHNCVIADGKAGICRVRVNEKSTLYTANYNKVTGLAVDPVEKKPLYHFMPGSLILSAGTAGCNFRCCFCQNWDISQSGARGLQDVDPDMLLDLSRNKRSIGIAYTYSEPIVWYETMRDTAPMFREAGQKNVMVTNGYISREPLEEILPFIDGMNIDVKAFTEDFYREMCSGKLRPVKENVEFLYDKTHIELTMLIIPGKNDDPGQVAGFVDWVASLDPAIPVHFSRYHPQYKLKLPATPQRTMLRVYELAKKKLKFVYAGNIRIPGTADTICPGCQNLLVSREGYRVEVTGLKDGSCNKCGYKVKGVWS